MYILYFVFTSLSIVLLLKIQNFLNNSRNNELNKFNAYYVVIITKQLATAYKTDSKQVSQGFNTNKGKFIEGKHYIRLAGEELRRFKTNRQIGDSMKKVSIFYLWTEKGALLHAKSLNTDRAWEVYDYLVDFYFRAKENAESVVRRKDSTVKKSEPAMKPQELSVEDVKRMGMNRGIVLGVYRAENKYTSDDIMEVYNLLSDKGKKLVQSLIFGEMRA